MHFCKANSILRLFGLCLLSVGLLGSELAHADCDAGYEAVAVEHTIESSYASTVYSSWSADYPAENAHDESTSTYWCSADSSIDSSEYIYFDLGAAKPVNKVVLDNYDSHTFDLQVCPSTDWSDCITVVTGESGGGTYDFAVQTGRYVRMSNMSSTYYAGIYDIEIHGPGDCVNIDECADNPCKYGGSCTDSAGSYSCSCSDPFIPAADGLNCECPEGSNASHELGYSEIPHTADPGAASSPTLLHGSYFNAWSRHLYYESEIGLDIEPATITKLSVYVSVASTFSMDNTKIYIADVGSLASLALDAPAPSNYTLVFSGDITFDSVGWKTIDITDFDYDGTGNLEVAFVREGSDWTYSEPEFRYSTTTASNIRLVRDFSDSSLPTTGNGYTSFYHMRFDFETTCESSVTNCGENEFVNAIEDLVKTGTIIVI